MTDKKYTSIPITPELKFLIDEEYHKLKREKKVKSYDDFIRLMFEKWK